MCQHTFSWNSIIKSINPSSPKTTKSTTTFVNKKPSNSFGKDFVAPQRTAGRAFVQKNNSAEVLAKREAAKKADEEKVQDIIRRSREKLTQAINNPVESEETATIATVFNEGDRVFHEKFGIGHIQTIQQIGSSTMFMIDFGAQGKKAMDSTFAKLQKF